MDWECLVSDDLWVSCTPIDETTSPTHVFVRIESRKGAEHKWIPNNRIKRVVTGLESSH